MSQILSENPRKIAIITGAGTGIGAAIALRLARLRWRVVLGGRRRDKLEEVAAAIRTGGGEAVVVPCDATLPADVSRLVAAAGPTLDALIHSAGKGHCLTIDELTLEEWNETIGTATTGAFLTAKLALPKLRATAGGPGHIIEICSLASGGTWNKEIGYGTAKGAQLKFALHLASQMRVEAEAGGRRIHVHAICPGTVDTPFWTNIPQRTIEPGKCLGADEVAWVVEQVIANPAATAEALATVKPRREIVIKRHAPFERWDNVIALAHESHP
ncbi:MAG TPA: SDR family oxidoreductase [Lacunisphaera sp.]|nr:SDR family oxidoreductase [Lacunisphaera sp.]